MAIKLTYRQLLEAANSGALQRFFGLRKTIGAAHRNRKLPAAIDEELKAFEAQRKALIETHSGALPEGATNYVFPDGELAAFERDFAELQVQELELPGEPVKVGELLDGGLLETDFARLDPFLVDG